MRITFRKGKTHSGLMRLPETYAVNVDGVERARIQKMRYEDKESWYWYGEGHNTASQIRTLEQCKEDVKNYLRSK